MVLHTDYLNLFAARSIFFPHSHSKQVENSAAYMVEGSNEEFREYPAI